MNFVARAHHGRHGLQPARRPHGVRVLVGRRSTSWSTSSARSSPAGRRFHPLDADTMGRHPRQSRAVTAVAGVLSAAGPSSTCRVAGTGRCTGDAAGVAEHHRASSQAGGGGLLAYPGPVRRAPLGIVGQHARGPGRRRGHAGRHRRNGGICLRAFGGCDARRGRRRRLVRRPAPEAGSRTAAEPPTRLLDTAGAAAACRVPASPPWPPRRDLGLQRGRASGARLRLRQRQAVRRHRHQLVAQHCAHETIANVGAVAPGVGGAGVPQPSVATHIIVDRFGTVRRRRQRDLGRPGPQSTAVRAVVPRHLRDHQTLRL